MPDRSPSIADLLTAGEHPTMSFEFFPPKDDARQEQLAREGRRPQLRAELNHIAGILDSLAHTGLASVLPARAQRLPANQQLLWKPVSEPPIALQVGLLYRDSQRQQASLGLLRA